jgi:hypothetical protein
MDLGGVDVHAANDAAIGSVKDECPIDRIKLTKRKELKFWPALLAIDPGNLERMAM